MEILRDTSSVLQNFAIVFCIARCAAVDCGRRSGGDVGSSRALPPHTAMAAKAKISFKFTLASDRNQPYKVGGGGSAISRATALVA